MDGWIVWKPSPHVDWTCKIQTHICCLSHRYFFYRWKHEKEKKKTTGRLVNYRHSTNLYFTTSHIFRCKQCQSNYQLFFLEVGRRKPTRRNPEEAHMSTNRTCVTVYLWTPFQTPVRLQRKMAVYENVFIPNTATYLSMYILMESLGLHVE